MRIIVLLAFILTSSYAFSQDSAAIKRINAIVKQINTSELTVLRDTIKTDYPANGLSFRTYLTALVKDKELKKYDSKMHSTTKANGVVSEMHANSTFYFDSGKLIKVEEKAVENGKEHIMDWYYENDQPIHYTNKSERSAERAEMLLKMSKGFLQNLKL